MASSGGERARHTRANLALSTEALTGDGGQSCSIIAAGMQATQLGDDSDDAGRRFTFCANCCRELL